MADTTTHSHAAHADMITYDEHVPAKRTSSHLRRQLTDADLEPKPDSKVNKVTKTDHPVTLAWKNVTYNVEIDNSDAHKADPSSQPKKRWRKLLDNMSGIALPGRTLAIMGPSGAGKTTLMSALTGRLAVNSTQVLDGRCEANGVPLTNELKRLVSVVAQDDIVMGKETPRDALNFSVRMRQGLSSADADAAVENILDILSLQQCADTQIGIPGIAKGISSSEKKRTNIGSELITDPYIMILDEPTTGLDSVNASRIGQILRDLAHASGRTVVCTIHTPSSELFNMFDDLLLLGKGHVVYHGPRADAVRYFASIGHGVPPRTNPTEHYMNLLQKPIDELQQLWEAWERNMVEDKTNPCINFFPTAPANEKEVLLSKCADKSCPVLLQFVLLYRRAWRMLIRDMSATMGRLFQMIYLGIIVGLFYFKVDRDWAGAANLSGVLFLIVMNIMFSSSMPGVVMFPAERAVFLMEQANAIYNPIPYSLAKIAAEVPFNAVFPILYTCIVYFMIDLRREADAFFLFMFITVLNSTVSFSFGLAASTIFPRSELAMAVVPLVILPLTLVSGLIANTERLDPDWMWLSYLSFPRYTYVAYCDIEFRGREMCNDKTNPNTICRYLDGNDYLRQQGFSNWRWTKSVWLFVIEIIAFWIICCLALFIQGVLRRGKMSFSDVGEESPEAIEARNNKSVDGASASEPIAAIEGSDEKQPSIAIELQQIGGAENEPAFVPAFVPQ